MLEDSQDYDGIQDGINDIVDDINRGQEEDGLRGDSPFVLRVRKPLNPGEQFTFLLSELLMKQQADWYFYEFKGINRTF